VNVYEVHVFSRGASIGDAPICKPTVTARAADEAIRKGIKFAQRDTPKGRFVVHTVTRLCELDD
jgi:hypothetical protein